MIYASTAWNTYEVLTGLIVRPGIYIWPEESLMAFVYRKDLIQGIGSVIVITRS